MGFDQNIFLDSSAGLRSHDYCTAGLHFVTLCTYQRRCLFGDIADGSMQLNACGNLVTSIWCDIGLHHSGVSAGAFVLMPNHIHGVLLLRQRGCADDGECERRMHAGGASRAATLGEVVRAFRARCQQAVNIAGERDGSQVWQDNFHTHAIGDRNAYEDTLRYIENDPLRWQQDIYYEDPQRAICRALFRRPPAGRWARCAV